MQKPMKVGWFREFSDNPAERDKLPTILSAISPVPQKYEREIANYLEGGVVLGGYRSGLIPDVLLPRVPMALCADFYSDGKYYWRRDLPYYVRTYHLRLPEEVIAHMKSRNWVAPT